MLTISYKKVYKDARYIQICTRKIVQESNMNRAKLLEKLKKKFVRMSGYQIMSDSIYMVVMYVITGHTILAFGSLSLMKLISTVSYMLHDEIKYKSVWTKSLGWEVIISIIGVSVNLIMLGSIHQSLTIMMSMKVMIPIHAVWLKYTA